MSGGRPSADCRKKSKTIVPTGQDRGDQKRFYFCPFLEDRHRKRCRSFPFVHGGSACRMVSAHVPGGAGGVLVRNSIPGAFWHASNTEQAALFSPNQLILLGRKRIRRGLRPKCSVPRRQSRGRFLPSFCFRAQTKCWSPEIQGATFQRVCAAVPHECPLQHAPA
jgi:hypothetical protein